MTVLDKQLVADILTGRPGNYYATADEKERQMFREWVTSLLRAQEANIVFEKLDGSVRDMRCTLMENRLPPAKTTTQSRPENVTNCVVWDCNQEAWRSFRWDRIKEIKVTLGAEED